MTDFSHATAQLPMMMEPETLAARLPVLSVHNTLILPHATVPVMVYANRDMRVVNRALSLNKIIGIVQERISDHTTMQGPRYSLAERPRIPVFQTGCAASIQGFQETEGGMLIILQGICRFSLTNKYLSQARLMHHVSYENYQTDTYVDQKNTTGHNDLLATLSKNPDLYDDDAETLEDLLQSSSNKVITSLAQSPLFSAGEKQALLESKNVDERCSLVTTLLEVNQPGVHITRH